ncbi:MAG: histidine kinase [Prevotella sp.]|nr:histidine kinase [Prevotella sp.]
MDKNINSKKETLVYLILWCITFLAPLLSLYISTSASEGQESFHWGEVFHIWIIYVPFLVVFLVHNFLLAPLLIYRRKKALYVAATLCTVAAFVVVQCINRPKMNHADRKEGPRQELPLGERPPLPPDFKGELPHPHHKPPTIIQEHDIVRTIVLVLLLGMNLGVKIYYKSDSEHEQLKQLERENLRQQLEYLKYQINPHFFMNTLNNIHALVDIDPQKAQHSIVVLSKMMRYLLYESNQAMVPLAKELDFVNNYIALMRMRYTEKVHINVNLPNPATDIPQNIEVPPMLFITFIENAFKHGVSYQQDSDINIQLTATDNLHFICENSCFSKPVAEQGGVGLANVRKRLDLIYHDSYQLQIDNTQTRYKVTLITPHSTFHIPHSTLHTPHSTLHTPHSTLHTPHST